MEIPFIVAKAVTTLVIFFAIAGYQAACLAADAVFLACTLEKWQQTGGADVTEIFTLEPGFSIWPIGRLSSTKLKWMARPGWEGLEAAVIEESNVLVSAEAHERIRMPLSSAVDACIAQKAQIASNGGRYPEMPDADGAGACARQVELSKESKRVLVTVQLDRVTGALEVWRVQGDKQHSVVQRGHCELLHPKF